MFHRMHNASPSKHKVSNFQITIFTDYLVSERCFHAALELGTQHRSNRVILVICHWLSSLRMIQLHSSLLVEIESAWLPSILFIRSLVFTVNNGLIMT